MNRIRLIICSLRYYRWPYLAIFAGVVLSTAVLTGALILGDSARHSLRHLAEIRLGKTRFAINPGERLFRQELAGDLSERTGSLIVPVMQAEGIAVNTGEELRINKVNIFGIDHRFAGLWDLSGHTPGEDEVIISRNVAEKIKVKTGDEILLKIRRPGKALQNAPFVAEKLPSVSLRFKVSAIAGDMQMGRFSLRSNQAAPFNVFISLKQMADRLDLSGYSNMLLFTGSDDHAFTPGTIDSLIRTVWKTADAGITIQKPDGGNTGEISSDRVFMDEQTAEAVINAIPSCDRILTYLVNSIECQGKSIPYSFVTAASPDFLGEPLDGDEIIINEWLAGDLGVRPGELIRLRYYKMGRLGTLKEETATFTVKSVIPLTSPLEDRTLMPHFPGISQVSNCRDWETSAPIDLQKIRDRDEQYWERWRGTPKAFIALSAGQRIWNNFFGRYTAFRFKADEKKFPDIGSAIMKKLTPAGSGLTVVPVFEEGKMAAVRSTDLGTLFLSLSFFLILAGLLLTALLFSLHARSRMAETGVMAAVGFRKTQILTILFLEALTVTICGGLFGVATGILYNRLLLLGLNTLWRDAVGTMILEMSLDPGTLATGFFTGTILSLGVLLMVLTIGLRKPLSSLVKGEDLQTIPRRRRAKKLSLILAIVLFLVSLALVGYLILVSQTGQTTLFLAAGGVMLAAGITFMNYLFLMVSGGEGKPLPRFTNLVLKNAGLRRTRSLAVIILMALGIYSIIITGANRKTFIGLENDRQSGTGGFLFWAETPFPIPADLNSQSGKKQFSLEDEPVLKDIRFIQMQHLDGDDASCLNLNQVTQPVILAIDPVLFDHLRCFTFTILDESVDQKRPWKTLDKAPADNVIPAYADQTVITWGLRKAVGDTLVYHDETGALLKVVLKGGLDNSIFQGNILVSDSLFRLHFPSSPGSKYMLIDGPFENRDKIGERLETLFRNYGLMLTPAPERLAAFNAVENTYLSVFMFLGGLGIILGTVGLGIVLLRNVYERRTEIALYLALGFTRKTVRKMLMAEYLFLLLAGVITGLIPALAGILPSLVSPSFRASGLFLVLIILTILANGFLWIYFLVKKAVMMDLQMALKEE